MRRTGYGKRLFAVVVAGAVTMTTVFGTQRTVCASKEQTKVQSETGEKKQEQVLLPEVEKYQTVIEQSIAWTKEANKISADSSLFSGDFLKNAGTTAGDWYAIACSRLGYEEDYASYLAALTAYVEERYKESDKLDATKATEWHRIALAYLSVGGDPEYAGTDTNGKNINLIADGTFDFQRKQGKSLDAQGTNGLVWALITLDSMRYDVPDNTTVTRTSLIQHILDRQNPDGGFGLSGGESDVDMTAMVLQALALYTGDNAGYAVTNDEMVSLSPYLMEEVEQSIAQALTYLSDMQQSGGDYLVWGTPNCETLCQVLIALCSLGIHPLEDSRFIKNGNTLVDALMSYQTEEGGFAHTKGEGFRADNMATSQALCALAALCRFMYYGVSLYDYRDWTNPEDTDVYTINLFTGETTRLQGKLVFDEEDEESYNQIPKKLTTEYASQVNALYQKLKNAENKEEYTAVLAGLRQKKEKISEIQKEIDEINREIENGLYGGEELSAREAVQLLSCVEELSPYDQKQIENYEELLVVEKQVVGEKRSQLLSILAVAAVLFIVGMVWFRIRDRKKQKKQFPMEP